jgi:hypothetical protein
MRRSIVLILKKSTKYIENNVSYPFQDKPF